MVACFVDDGENGGRRTLTEKIKGFLKTRNLREFGKFRYAIAERASSGETHVMALWGDGDLKVSEMFPKTGDVPGSDSSVVARPPESRMILAAAAEGMPYALRIYESPRGRDELHRFFDTSMAAKGWQLVQGGARARQHVGLHARGWAPGVRFGIGSQGGVVGWPPSWKGAAPIARRRRP